MEPDASCAPAYTSDLSEVIDFYQPDYWIYGHTHFPVDVIAGKTRIMNVSLGYPHEVEPGQESALLLKGNLRLEGEDPSCLGYPTT